MIIPAPVKKKKTRKDEGDQEKEKKKAFAGMDHLQYLVYTYLRAYIHMYRVSTKCCCLSLPALAPRACLFFQWGKPEHVLGWLSGIIIC